MITWTRSPRDSFCHRMYCQEILMLVSSTAHHRSNSTWACPHTCWWCREHWTEHVIFIICQCSTSQRLPRSDSHADGHDGCSPRSCHSRCSPLGWQTVWLTYSEPPASPRLGSCPPGQGGTVGDCEFCVFYLASLQRWFCYKPRITREDLYRLPLLFPVLTRYCFLLVFIT